MAAAGAKGSLMVCSRRTSRCGWQEERESEAASVAHRKQVSDARSRRAGCMVAERWQVEAASVTAERVR